MKTQVEVNRKTFEVAREMLEVQGVDGTFNYSSYNHGLYNGMEFMLSIFEERSPDFRALQKSFYMREN